MNAGLLYSPPNSLVLNLTNKKSLPALKIDWTCKSGEMLIRDQGFCSGSYAFATLDTLSTINAIYDTSFFIPLSPQEIISSSFEGT